jgi:hypothetical protein
MLFNLRRPKTVGVVAPDLAASVTYLDVCENRLRTIIAINVATMGS